MKYLNIFCIFVIFALTFVYAAVESQNPEESSVADKMPAKRGIYGFGGYGHGFGGYYGHGHGHGYYGGHGFGGYYGHGHGHGYYGGHGFGYPAHGLYH